MHAAQWLHDGRCRQARILACLPRPALPRGSANWLKTPKRLKTAKILKTLKRLKTVKTMKIVKTVKS